MSARSRFYVIRKGMKAGAALLLLAGLFLLGVLLTPPAPPVQALAPPSAAASAATLGNGVKGTLASFTALIPQALVVHLPLIDR